MHLIGQVVGVDQGLPDSGTMRGHYEGFAVVNGQAISTGKFVVLGTGPGALIMNPEQTLTFGTAMRAEFGPSSTLLGQDFPFINDATHFFITIEPDGDSDPAPSCQVIHRCPWGSTGACRGGLRSRSIRACAVSTEAF